MITLNDWQLRKTEWLDKDLALMTTDAGWKKRGEKNGIYIYKQPFADDPNHLFRWRIPNVTADYKEVHDVFTNKMIDYHQYWTKEYTGGFLVKEIDEHTQIIYQQFNPGIPIISKRDLLYIQWSRMVDDKTIQTSFRSIVLDDFPVPDGFERIDWWGGHLFEANPDGSSQLVLIDRENQGGNFPSMMMNLVMPQYLTLQFESIIKFFSNGGVGAHAKIDDTNNTALKMKQQYSTLSKHTINT